MLVCRLCAPYFSQTKSILKRFEALFFLDTIKKTLNTFALVCKPCESQWVHSKVVFEKFRTLISLITIKHLLLLYVIYISQTLNIFVLIPVFKSKVWFVNNVHLTGPITKIWLLRAIFINKTLSLFHLILAIKFQVWSPHCVHMSGSTQKKFLGTFDILFLLTTAKVSYLLLFIQNFDTVVL